MRIVFITSKLNFKKSGGSIEEIDFIIRTLQKLGNQVTVVTAYSQHNDLPANLPYPVIEERLPGSGLFSIGWGGRALLKKYSPQADFFHVDHLFLYAAGAYKVLGGEVPVAVFFNMFLTCWPQYESSLFPRMRRDWRRRIKEKIRWHVEHTLGMWLANHAEVFSVVSPTLRAMYREFGLKTNDERTVVVGDPINFNKIMSDNGITYDSYSRRRRSAGAVILFFSSRMSPGKGFDLLLKGFSLVKNKDAFRVILGGTGPEEKYVRQMIRDLALEKYVTLTGWVTKERLMELHKDADIFIQADWWPAGTSISLLYALAFGLPSILPGGGGLEWLAGDSALYFKYRDPADLAKKIEQLGFDSVLREKLSRNCYRRLASGDFNYEERVEELNRRMNKIYQSKLFGQQVR